MSMVSFRETEKEYLPFGRLNIITSTHTFYDMSYVEISIAPDFFKDPETRKEKLDSLKSFWKQIKREYVDTVNPEIGFEIKALVINVCSKEGEELLRNPHAFWFEEYDNVLVVFSEVQEDKYALQKTTFPVALSVIGAIQSSMAPYIQYCKNPLYKSFTIEVYKGDDFITVPIFKPRLLKLCTLHLNNFLREELGIANVFNVTDKDGLTIFGTGQPLMAQDMCDAYAELLGFLYGENSRRYEDDFEPIEDEENPNVFLLYLMLKQLSSMVPSLNVLSDLRYLVKAWRHETEVEERYNWRKDVEQLIVKRV